MIARKQDKVTDIDGNHLIGVRTTRRRQNIARVNPASTPSQLHGACDAICDSHFNCVLYAARIKAIHLHESQWQKSGFGRNKNIQARNFANGVPFIKIQYGIEKINQKRSVVLIVKDAIKAKLGSQVDKLQGNLSCNIDGGAS